MAEILTLGTGERSSSAFTVASGEVVTVSLKSATPPVISGPVQADVQLQSGADFYTVDTLTDQRIAVALQAPGTYRVVARASGVQIGVHNSK